MQMGSLCNEMALKGKYLDERVSSSILLIGIEQAPLDESDVINRDARSVSHDYPMTCAIQFSNITGDRHIAASGFFIVRQKIGYGNIRLLLDVLLDNSKSGVNHMAFSGWMALNIAGVALPDAAPIAATVEAAQHHSRNERHVQDSRREHHERNNHREAELRRAMHAENERHERKMHDIRARFHNHHHKMQREMRKEQERHERNVREINRRFHRDHHRH